MSILKANIWFTLEPEPRCPHSRLYQYHSQPQDAFFASLSLSLGAHKVQWSESYSVMSNSLQPHGLYSPWNSAGQNTGMCSYSLLQGIFPTQGSNPGLPHCRQILYQLSPQGSPRILEWVAYAFSSRSSWPRNWTRVSCRVHLCVYSKMQKRIEKVKCDKSEEALPPRSSTSQEHK